MNEINFQSITQDNSQIFRLVKFCNEYSNSAEVLNELMRIINEKKPKDEETLEIYIPSMNKNGESRYVFFDITFLQEQNGYLYILNDFNEVSLDDYLDYLIKQK